MKKLFSLLLVGIVAISMFAFIAPNSVDATEAEPSKGTVYVKNATEKSGYGVRFVVDFYDASGNNIGCYKSNYLSRTEKKCCTIPQEAKSVTVLTAKKVNRSTWDNVSSFVFKLDKSNDSLDGSIQVNAIGDLLKSADFTYSSTGCWKFDHKEIF